MPCHTVQHETCVHASASTDIGYCLGRFTLVHDNLRHERNKITALEEENLALTQENSRITEIAQNYVCKWIDAEDKVKDLERKLKQVEEPAIEYREVDEHISKPESARTRASREYNVLPENGHQQAAEEAWRRLLDEKDEEILCLKTLLAEAEETLRRRRARGRKSLEELGSDLRELQEIICEYGGRG